MEIITEKYFRGILKMWTIIIGFDLRYFRISHVKLKYGFLDNVYIPE